MKRIIILAVIFLVSTCLSHADLIKLTDGKVVRGFIMYFENGIYTVLINGKKYPLPEDRVKAIKWEASDNQISSAYKGEPEPKRKRAQAAGKKYAAFSADLITVRDPAISSLTGGTFFFPGIEYGFVLGNVHYGLRFTATGYSGKGEYNISGKDIFGEYTLSRTLIMLKFVNMTPFKIAENLPFSPFLGFGLGGGVAVDTLGGYPLNPESFYDPVLIKYGDKTEVYASFAFSAKAGIVFEPVENIKCFIYAGYFALTAQTYRETGLVYPFMGDDILGFTKKSTDFGGFTFGLEAAVVFE